MSRYSGGVFALATALFLSGCWMYQEAFAPPWAYVYKVGHAKEISAWALQQTYEPHIKNGFEALLNGPLAGEKAAEAEEAQRGAILVVKKLESGWPGLVIWSAQRQEPIALESVSPGERGEAMKFIMNFYYLTAAECAVSLAQLKVQPNRGLEVLRQIKPDSNRPELLAEWDTLWTWAQQRIGGLP